MADGQGAGEAETLLEYYHDGEATPESWGHLKTVTDANGVVTRFGYDKWGYQSWFVEGEFSCGEVENTVAGVPVEGGGENPNDPAGRPTGPINSDTSACPSYLTWNSNDSVTNSVCPCILLGSGDAPLGNVPTPVFGFFRQCLNGTSYDVRGLPLSFDRCIDVPVTGTAGVGESRKHTFTYDDVQRLTSITNQLSNSNGTYSSGALTRTMTIDEYDPENRVLSATLPGGQTIEFTYDELGRLETFERGDMSAELTYDDAGRVSTVEYGNGAYTTYYYDEANRIESIQHKVGINLLLGIDYTWTVNNWVSQRVETTSAGVATVNFEYDNRGRLIRETREFDDGVTIETTYDLSYEYDQLGNRLKKTDAVAELETQYLYDVHDPNNCELESPTWHNRLKKYVIFDTSGEDPVRLRTVRYTYYKAGMASNITIKDEDGDPNAVNWYYDLALYYWTHGPLRYALWGRWMVDGNGDPIDASYEPLAAKEFWFDSARGRYLSHELSVIDPNSGMPSPDYWDWQSTGPLQFTDYLGDTPLGDFAATLNGGKTGIDSVLNTTRYFGLSGHQTLDPNEHCAETRYWHEDLIGSTSLTTDGAGDPAERIAYSAFGEVLTTGGVPGGAAPAGAPRYQYAGAYGYESDLLTLQGANPNLPPITLQHLGHRWYQPDLGRFVQRDPIGIRGEFNVFTASLSLVDKVDPKGTQVTVLRPRFSVPDTPYDPDYSNPPETTGELLWDLCAIFGGLPNRPHRIPPPCRVCGNRGSACPGHIIPGPPPTPKPSLPPVGPTPAEVDDLIRRLRANSHVS